MTDDDRALLLRAVLATEGLLELARRGGQAPRQAAASGPASGGKRVATPAEMDSDKGNPTVKWDPPRWKKADKPSEAGRRLSECSPEYLDAVADFADFKADKPMPGKEQYVESDRQMAALARGWAERRRAAPAQSGSNVPPGEEWAPF